MNGSVDVGRVARFSSHSLTHWFAHSTETAKKINSVKRRKETRAEGEEEEEEETKEQNRCCTHALSLSLCVCVRDTTRTSTRANDCSTLQSEAE